MQDTLIRVNLTESNTDALGYIWAYRLILDREPTSEEIDIGIKQSSPEALARTLLVSREFDSLLTTVSETSPALALEERPIAVQWAFRLFLGREVGDERTLSSVVESIRSTSDIRRMIAFSEEFRVRDDKALSQLLTSEVAKDYRPFCGTPAPPGYFSDFLGNKTRCSFLPEHFTSISQSILGPPGSTTNPPLHDAAEWVGTLRAANEASGTFTVVELGAGWAPWLVVGHNLARRKGITNVHLIGVEGDKGHMKFMEQNFIDNGIDPTKHSLIFGVVGTSDGLARFPKIDSSQADYGSAAVYDDTDSSRPMIEVPCFSLAGLLRGLPHIVDLIHCDIQGSEAEVMAATEETLNEKVRRVVIGTHSRTVEGLLLDQFSGMGWKLEHESVCTYRQNSSGVMGLHIDGVQVWRNPNI